MTCDPVGLKEIAERLGYKVQTVQLWSHQGDLPEPPWRVSGQPAWDWPTIATWAQQRGKRSP